METEQAGDEPTTPEDRYKDAVTTALHRHGVPFSENAFRDTKSQLHKLAQVRHEDWWLREEWGEPTDKAIKTRLMDLPGEFLNAYADESVARALAKNDILNQMLATEFETHGRKIREDLRLELGHSPTANQIIEKAKRALLGKIQALDLETRPGTDPDAEHVEGLAASVLEASQNRSPFLFSLDRALAQIEKPGDPNRTQALKNVRKALADQWSTWKVFDGTDCDAELLTELVEHEERRIEDQSYFRDPAIADQYKELRRLQWGINEAGLPDQEMQIAHNKLRGVAATVLARSGVSGDHLDSYVDRALDLAFAAIHTRLVNADRRAEPQPINKLIAYGAACARSKARDQRVLRLGSGPAEGPDLPDDTDARAEFFLASIDRLEQAQDLFAETAFELAKLIDTSTPFGRQMRPKYVVELALGLVAVQRLLLSQPESDSAQLGPWLVWDSINIFDGFERHEDASAQAKDAKIAEKRFKQLVHIAEIYRNPTYRSQFPDPTVEPPNSNGGAYQRLYYLAKGNKNEANPIVKDGVSGVLKSHQERLRERVGRNL